MLEPRETDIPALFLVFVVLPLVMYVLLGKWSTSTKKNERISLLAQQAAEEALRVEALAAASVIPLLLLPNTSMNKCTRCCGRATTRCSQCKAVWYCSGKCQILHWREFHKHECQQLHNSCSISLPKSASKEEFHEKVSFDGKIDSQPFEYNVHQPILEITPSDIHSPVGSLPSAAAASMKPDNSGFTVTERRSIDKRPSRKGLRDSSNRGDGPLSECLNQASVKESDSFWSDPDVNISSGVNANSRNILQESHTLQRQGKHVFDTRNHCAVSRFSNVGSNGMDSCNIQTDLNNGGTLQRKEITPHDELAGTFASSERASMKRRNQVKTTSHSQGTKLHKSPKSMVKSSREQSCLEFDQTGATANDSKITRTKDAVPSQGKDGVTSLGIRKMIGLMKPSKLDRQEAKEVNADWHKKVKMLFPYGEFVKFFQCEVSDLLPRGLINCGNSCYANAVLQCLSCTKPLSVFLLRRSHSRACCVRDWCLICELEQHVMMLREIGGPLSPSRILSHMRTINCQIGDGSQEDAHEFLRLLVASMQSICLESLGGENVVDPRLQETTFIQHTFGGRLRSKVKCLKCHHESERSENIMDLTLEILGWVESLEDALMQFTSPEDLDGENMYRCSRCATYVRARKQLSIQEAPNILTIVLKRFQEGSYGKINKCISFPDMLDMVPFMTGTDDIPPLYMLYAVVVHLDNLNASFSGHYISYVKDLQGNWFRIDDTEVQAVEMSRVMSDRAYILFYMRSSPRPARTTRKVTCQQASGIPKQWPSRSHKSSRAEEDRLNHHSADSEPPSDYKWGMSFANYSSGGLHRSSNENRLPRRETYAQSMSTEFSDTTSSDWSLFTSSDEASFTTESTRDSFSTVDYTDASNVDSISSIFNTPYASEYPPRKTIACSMFSTSQPKTRFFSENTGSVSECYLPNQPLNRVSRRKNSRQVSVSPAEAFHADTTCGLHVRYGSDTRTGPPQTPVNCNI